VPSGFHPTSSQAGPVTGQTSTASGSRAHWPRRTLMRKPRALTSTHHEDAHRARFQARQPSTTAHNTDGHAFGKNPNPVHARHAPGCLADDAAVSVAISDGILRAGGASGRFAARRSFLAQREVSQAGEESLVGDPLADVADACDACVVAGAKPAGESPEHAVRNPVKPYNL
jgi:nitrate reductase cytochrome c-type subunit